MKRRELIKYGGLTALSAMSVVSEAFAKPTLAQGSRVSIKYLGHTCFLFSSGGFNVLVNPFAQLGCTAGYNSPNVGADLVLISSFLLDEGSIEQIKGNPKILTEPGDYKINNIKFQGIATSHDREGGRRFGQNIVWRWNQGNITILHLGGAAAPISIEEKILMGSPDIVLIPVGGGAKAYNPQEAKAAIDVLQPKMVIPTQYLTTAADKSNCDLVAIDEFLALTGGMNVQKLTGNSISLRSSDLPQGGTIVRVLNYS